MKWSIFDWFWIFRHFFIAQVDTDWNNFFVVQNTHKCIKYTNIQFNAVKPAKTQNKCCFYTFTFANSEKNCLKQIISKFLLFNMNYRNNILHNHGGKRSDWPLYDQMNYIFFYFHKSEFVGTISFLLILCRIAALNCILLVYFMYLYIRICVTNKKYYFTLYIYLCDEKVSEKSTPVEHTLYRWFSILKI